MSLRGRGFCGDMVRGFHLGVSGNVVKMFLM